MFNPQKPDTMHSPLGTVTCGLFDRLPHWYSIWACKRLETVVMWKSTMDKTETVRLTLAHNRVNYQGSGFDSHHVHHL